MSEACEIQRSTISPAPLQAGRKEEPQPNWGGFECIAFDVGNGLDVAQSSSIRVAPLLSS